MKFGGDYKLNQYVFAHKDDPYHNSKRRDLYQEKKISENKKSDNEILTLRLNSKFNVKDGNEIKNFIRIEILKRIYTKIMCIHSLIIST